MNKFVAIVTAEVSMQGASFKYTLDDIGVIKKQWDSLDEQEKRVLLDQCLDAESDQPYWVIDRIEYNP